MVSDHIPKVAGLHLCLFRPSSESPSVASTQVRVGVMTLVWSLGTGQSCSRWGILVPLPDS